MLALGQRFVYKWTLGVDSDDDSDDSSQRAAATVIDSSDPLFSMYNETAGHDLKMAENWRSDADSAVIVVRHHFSLPVGYHRAQLLY